MTEPQSPERCRLVLLNPPGADWRKLADQTVAAMAGGDIASIILWPGGLPEDDFQRLCEAAIPPGQAAGIAMIVAGELRVARRTGADGIHVEGRRELEQLAGQDRALILGASGARTRHDALEIGEMRPDYVLFGRAGYDTRPEPHPRNLALGEWWSEMVEIPCIVMAGAQLESIRTAARTGSDFVAASAAIFAEQDDPAEAVRKANRLLADPALCEGSGR